MRLHKLCYLVIFLFVHQVAYTSEVDTLAIESEFLQVTNKSVIITPDSYKNTRADFPVLYLLHGYSGKYDNWIKLVPEIKEYADKYQMIVVCPDGGYAGWYLNSPLVDSNQYESFFIKELIPFIDSRYRTIAEKRGRGVTGLSMGGHGALFLAFKNMSLFGAAGSMSGALDINSIERYELGQLLGKTETDQRKSFSVYYQLTEELQGFPILIDCGKRDQFINDNIRVHEKLDKLEVDHSFIIRPGGHNWKYWSNAVEYHFMFFYKTL